MGKSSAPKPPDPRETSAAQTGTSVGTSIANTMLQNVNRVGADGSTLNYDQTGSYKYVDPYTGEKYKIPQFTATESLSPQAQATFDANQGAQRNLAELAQDRSGFLQGYLGQAPDYSGLQDRGGLPQAIDLTDDYSADRQRVEDALFGRLNTRLDRDRESMATRLANQGIRVGSEAYTRAMGDFGQNVNDARTAAILSAGQEQSRMQGDARANAQTEFNSGLAVSNAEEARRAAQMQEIFAQRNQPLNEISALMSGSQVSMPNFNVNQPSAIPTTDNAGLINQNYNQQLAAWQQRQQQAGGNLGGLFQLGGTIGAASIMGPGGIMMGR